MSFVEIQEVGPRDGLQNEPGVIPLPRKIALINALIDAGLKRIEVGAFVSPTWVPQMADTPDLLAQLPELDGRYDVLVPNQKGWNAFAASARPTGTGVAVFVAATEGFSKANLNCTIAESLERARPVAEAAHAAGVPVRGYISCVTDCPFEGLVPPADVARVAEHLWGLGVEEISLGDTIGQGTPDRVAQMLKLMCDVAPVSKLAGHFHDTGGHALANVEAALQVGLRVFDTAVGGLGGCPYAPGAPGNVATEAVVARLHDLGFETGIDLQKAHAAAQIARAMRGEHDNSNN